MLVEKKLIKVCKIRRTTQISSVFEIKYRNDGFVRRLTKKEAVHNFKNVNK